MAAGSNKERLDKKSADYEAMFDYQENIADILKGQTAMTKAGVRYLPAYPDETDAEYQFRLKYARFTNVWRDMAEGLAAKPFEREIQFDETETVDERFKELSDDVDGSGHNMTIFAMDYFFYAIAYSVDYLFVDYPKVPLAVGADGKPITRSVADEQALGIRPYWSRISCRNVYEVQTKLVQGKELITYIRIFEPAHAGTNDRFREMIMNTVGVASYVIWEWNVNAKDYVILENGPITIGYIPIVPLMTGRRIGKSFQSYPPLKDASELQITLYRAESNLEVTKVYAAYPMLVGVGVKPTIGPDEKPARLIRGPGIALYAPMSGSGHATDWKFIEPGGQTLAFLQSDCDKLKQDLRELGKQPLTVTSGNLTTITTAVAAGKAKSAVKAWATGLADALTMAYWFTSLWMGLGDDAAPSVVVYQEFDEFIEPGTDVNALIQMKNAGLISLDRFWAEMRRRNILSVDFNPEAERTALLADVPNVEDNQPENRPPQ